MKPSEAFLRLPPLLPCGDLALLVPIVVYRQYPGASAQICKLQVYHARQGLMSLQRTLGYVAKIGIQCMHMEYSRGVLWSLSAAEFGR